MAVVLCQQLSITINNIIIIISAYSCTRASFMKKLQKLLEDNYEEFESLDNIEKLSYVQGCEE